MCHIGLEWLLHPNDTDHYGHQEGEETAHFIVIRPKSSLLGAGKECDQVVAPWKMLPPGSARKWQQDPPRPQGPWLSNRDSLGAVLGERNPREGHESFFKNLKSAEWRLLFYSQKTQHKQTKNVTFLCLGLEFHQPRGHTSSLRPIRDLTAC